MITELEISGMRTVHCTRALFTALAMVPGISSAEVEIGRAVIEHDGRATLDLLREAVRVAGFETAAVREERRRLRTL